MSFKNWSHRLGLMYEGPREDRKALIWDNTNSNGESVKILGALKNDVVTGSFCLSSLHEIFRKDWFPWILLSNTTQFTPHLLIFDRLLNNNQLNQLPSGIFSNYTQMELL